MKKLVYTIVFASFVFSSCDSVLEREPLDIISDTTVWDDPVLVDAYILDVYSHMYFMYNDYDTNQDQRNDIYTINAVADQSTNGRPNQDVVVKWQAGLLDENGGLEQWHYSNIRKMNDFFDKMESSTISEEEKKLFAGRIKFARALTYFTMVKWYGGIPIITESQAIDTPIEELQVPRNKEQEVYDFVISECDEIINNEMLPNDFSGARLGDPTAYVAQALKSRAALYAASIARWGTVQIDGLVGIPQDQENRYWQISYDASRAIIDGPFSLYQKSDNLVDNYQQAFVDEDNSEVIWAKYYDGVTVNNDWSVDHSVLGAAPSWMTENICPYLELVENFENKDGEIIPWDREAVASKIWTFDELYGNLEPRFHANIWTHGSNWEGFNPVLYYNGIKTADGEIIRDGIYEGLPALGANYRTSGRDFSGFSIKKGVDPTGDLNNRRGKNMKIQFRLGEILLNYAEAAFYLNKNDEALNAVNKIRERVALPLHTVIDVEKIRHERRIELAFEALRHWDLKRWRIAEEAISNTWTGVNYIYDFPTGNFWVEYKENFRTSNFDEKHYYFPITPARIANNPALAPENPGY